MKKNTKIVFGVIVLLIIGVIFLSFANTTKQATYNEHGFTRAVYGNENASVVVKEFSDLQCPACASANRVFVKIREEYKDKIRFEFYHYPLTEIHSNAFLAAQGAECAKDKGKFWEFADLAYENQGNLNRNGLIDIAKETGFDTDLFTNCLDSKAKKDEVMNDMALGNSLNIFGTPYFLGKEDLKDYTEKDKMHLTDVKELIGKIILTFYLLLIGLILILTYFLIYKNYREIGLVFIFGFCFLALILILLYFINFDYLFLKFHLVSFNNDLWLLSEDESLLIRIFNSGFFMKFFYKILERAFLTGSVLFLIGTYFFKRTKRKI